jgi:hypothetical protein
MVRCPSHPADIMCQTQSCSTNIIYLCHYPYNIITLTSHIYKLELWESSRALQSLKHASADQKLKLATAHQKLLGRIEHFNQHSACYIPLDNIDDCISDNANDIGKSINIQDAIEDYEDSDEIITEHTEFESLTSALPEHMLLNLPSELGYLKCHSLGISRLTRCELRLRRGHANSILHQIRIDLGYKAFLYRMTVRQAKLQQASTRARRLIKTSAANINRLKLQYNLTREAMVCLGANENTLDHYKVITDHDLRVITTIG